MTVKLLHWFNQNDGCSGTYGFRWPRILLRPWNPTILAMMTIIETQQVNNPSTPIR
jgi:hypothetical protein